MLDGHSTIVWQGAIYIWGGKAEPAAVGPGGGAAPNYYSADMYVLDPAQCTSASSADLSLVRISNGADRSAVDCRNNRLRQQFKLAQGALGDQVKMIVDHPSGKFAILAAKAQFILGPLEGKGFLLEVAA